MFCVRPFREPSLPRTSLQKPSRHTWRRCVCFRCSLLSKGCPSRSPASAESMWSRSSLTALARWKPNTANNRYRGLQQFFKWCEEEGEVKESPMARMKPPRVPEETPPIRSEQELIRLLKACEGTAFRDRRDMALVRLFLDTGARRSELANLTVADIDFELNVVLVVGKGARPRACPLLATSKSGTLLLRRDQGGDGRVLGLPEQAVVALALG
jgi:site-specific recombinase XerD